jgi:hypothetical protein
MDGQTPIDLSGGLVPAPTPPPSPPTQTPIDLSGGLVPAQTAPDAQTSSWLDSARDILNAPNAANMGVLKGAAHTATGIVDLLNRGMHDPANPTAPPVPLSPALKRATDWVNAHTQAQGVAEKSGEIAESVAELMTPEALMEAGKVPEAMSFADHLSEAAKNAKILENSPVIRRLVKVGIDASRGATRAGAEMGAQTLVKTGGDTDKAATAALVGGATGGVLRGGLSSVGELADVLRPSSETLEGTQIPVAASQRAGASMATKLANAPEDLPAMEAQRQAAAPQIIRNGARRALKTVLENVNQTRGEMQGPADEFGVQPGAYKFTISPHGTPVETTDPGIVQKILSEAQDLKDSSDFDEMSDRQQTRTQNTIDDLTRQMDEYHADRATRPHFTPVDVDALVKSTDDYGTAGEHMQNSVDDIYQRMRGAANEQLDKKWLKQLSPEQFNQLMADNADKFSPEERQIATDTFRKGAVLKEYHKAIQQGFNISPAQAAATADIGGQRTFTGSDKISNAIDDVVSQRGDDLRSMVGDQGINSVRRLNQLMKGPETTGPLQQLLRNTASLMRRHYGSTAGFIGAGAAPFLGVTHLTGVGTGVAAGYALKKVVNAMATNPQIADRIAYAVEHGVSTRIAAPLISIMMIRATEPEGEQPNAGSPGSSVQPQTQPQ